MNETIDPLKAYTEACSTLRHYSNASFTVRVTSVTQGIILLTGWTSVITGDNSKYAFLIPFAGLLFTGLLYQFNRGYFETTEDFYKLVADMEKKLFDDEDYKPFKKYQEIHEQKYGNRWSKILITNAPFTLIGTLFFIAFLFSIFNLFIAF